MHSDVLYLGVSRHSSLSHERESCGPGEARPQAVLCKTNAEGMPYELISLDKQNIRLGLDAGLSITLGRRIDLGVTTRNVSREHCLIECQKAGEAKGILVYVKAGKRCYVTGPSRQQPCKLASGQSTQVRRYLSCLACFALRLFEDVPCDVSSSMQSPAGLEKSNVFLAAISG